MTSVANGVLIEVAETPGFPYSGSWDANILADESAQITGTLGITSSDADFGLSLSGSSFVVTDLPIQDTQYVVTFNPDGGTFGYIASTASTAGLSGTGGVGNTPPVSPPQGNNGGIGALSSGNVRSGGGGGAAAQGEDGPTIPTPNLGGDGGIGAPTAIFGSAPQAPTYGTPGPAPGRYFAGGGAGRGGYSGNSGTAGSGGSGGGGGGASNGCTNTGGGGGGNRVGTAGSGGSGIIIIKHTTADATPSVSGGNVVLTCGSHTIRIFTGSGTFVP